MELVVNRAVEDAHLKAVIAVSKGYRCTGLCYVDEVCRAGALGDAAQLSVDLSLALSRPRILH